MMESPRIAIVGGGPAGLTLARILQVNGLMATVFEGEDSPLVRSQGGTLDLPPNSGQMALRHAGLETEFRAIARYEDQAIRFCDKAGQLLSQKFDGADGDRPEVERAELRRMLLDSLQPGTVEWAHKVRAIQPLAGDQHEILCDDGCGIFDLVVGTDGAWSRVRPLVSMSRPIYSVRRTRHSRGLVRQILRGQRSDVFRARESSLEVCLPWLDAQWAAEARNSATLLRQLKLQGFRGSRRIFGTWATRRSRADRIKLERLQRVPSARTLAQGR